MFVAKRILESTRETKGRSVQFDAPKILQTKGLSGRGRAKHLGGTTYQRTRSLTRGRTEQPVRGGAGGEERPAGSSGKEPRGEDGGGA